MKYIECLFIGEEETLVQSSGIKGTNVLSVTDALSYVEKQLNKGISYFLVFGVTSIKSIEHATNDSYCVCEFLKMAKQQFNNRAVLIADVGVSPYTADGQSVIYKNNKVDEEMSYEAVCKLSEAFALSGADSVAPCLSLPKQVDVIKETFENKNLRCDIMSYSTKFSSSLYGPYRSTIQSSMGNIRKEYQSDYSDSKEALNQLIYDIDRGANCVIVKPALHYLDVISQAKKISTKPVAAYHVSGEYMMAKLSIEHGLVDELAYFNELYSSFHRAGADFVIGYAPEHFLNWKESIRSI